MFAQKNMRALLLPVIIFFFQTDLYAQPYISGGNTRHRFAQMTVGLDTRIFTGNAHSFMPDGNGGMNKTGLQDYKEARILIGGTHFWGHADFHIAIPVLQSLGAGFSTSVETIAKIYPWRIRHSKLRPYAGFSFLPVHFAQGEGTLMTRYQVPLLAGLTFNAKKHLFDLGFGYYPNSKHNYYITPELNALVKMYPYSVSLSYKYMFEITLSAEKNWQSGHTRILTDTLDRLGRLNGFTISAGPSTMFFTKGSAYNDKAPYLDDHRAAGIYLDAGIGYYLHRPDIQINLAFRKYTSTIVAYGHMQSAGRTSITLEAYKFLTDYHGFAVFAGPAVSYEHLKVSETDKEGNRTSAAYKGVRPGITAGWDIRPNRLQLFYLRTNLRYFPGLGVEMPDGKEIAFDALEVNFIQLVLFPGRIF